ncbi:deoxyribonuclease V [Chitinophaga sp. Cy-1792]|uniref:deoxyribonuclease V n=1 Tax=Chitinophaga sp. Cy-1792 TaxID=2608339 RepID=UPI0014249DA7|nr:deoxyribonuclease V [Chitinophaga sp. Cy-1792]
MNYTDYNTLSVPEATIRQKELKEQVVLQPLPEKISYIAGTDISFDKFSTHVFAGIVLLSFPDLKPVACSLIKKEVKFPYVPGYLAFREVPGLLDAWEQLAIKPDVVVLDGHGIAHPRRMGIASHFGVLINKPALGCAKKKLFGIYEEPGNNAGDYTPLYDKQQEIIGNVLRTKTNVKPVFISPGHLSDVDSSRELIRQCVTRYRLPEPTRHAHAIVNQFRLGTLSEGYTTF